MTSIKTTLASLRKLAGIKKMTGSADVSAIGITYSGKPITTLTFLRAQVVEYRNGEKLIAAFQDAAWIDD